MVAKRIIGAVVGGGIAIFGGVTATGDDTVRNDAGEITESGGLGAFSIREGDCFNNPDVTAELVQSVEGVPCTGPHQNEVYEVFNMTQAGPFPGQAAVDIAAEDGCYNAFSPFIGQAYETSLYWFGAFFPSEGSWAQGDREIVCYVHDGEGGMIVGTLENSKL